MACYKQLMQANNFDGTCKFLGNNSTVFLHQTNFSVDYLYSMFSQTFQPFVYFIIDNTPFPQNGSMPKGNITLNTQYAAYIEPTKHYLKMVLTCKFLEKYCA